MVPAGERHEGRFQVIIDAMNLATYSLKVLSNPKNFDPNMAPMLLDELNKTCLEIYVSIKTANDCDLFTAPRDRLRHQRIAHDNCVRMVTLLSIGRKVYGIDSRRLIYWTENIVKVRNGIRRWMKSDEERLKAYNKKNKDTTV